MNLKKFENDTRHRANEVLYFVFFGVFIGLFSPNLESGKVATFNTLLQRVSKVLHPFVAALPLDIKI
jgi:hypothetical protein